jgi:hypothetical protein
MNYSVKPKYILISGDAVFFSKWGVTQNMLWVNPGLNLGRTAVLLALFDIMITAVST